MYSFCFRQLPLAFAVCHESCHNRFIMFWNSGTSKYAIQELADGFGSANGNILVGSVQICLRHTGETSKHFSKVMLYHTGWNVCKGAKNVEYGEESIPSRLLFFFPCFLYNPFRMSTLAVLKCRLISIDAPVGYNGVPSYALKL